jgi:hypothetical protein
LGWRGFSARDSADSALSDEFGERTPPHGYGFASTLDAKDDTGNSFETDNKENLI